MARRPDNGRPRRDPLYGDRPRSGAYRSSEPPLWGRAWPWWTLAAVLIGYPLVRDGTADRVQRNTYANSASCHCAYPQGPCTPAAGGRWTGPWYARDAADRLAGDPGEGRHCSRGGSGTGGAGLWTGRADASSGRTDISPRVGVESGYRGGFGGSGRIRAAGS